MTSSVNIIMFIYTKAMFGFFQVIQFFLEPKICIKYRKQGRYSFSSKIAYFDPKKYILKPKLSFFLLLYMLLSTLMRTLQCAETLTFFSHEKTLKSMILLSKIAEMFSTHPGLPIQLNTININRFFQYFLYLVQIFAWSLDRIEGNFSLI